MKRKTLNYLLIFIGIPLVIAIGVVLFNDRKYNIISMLIAFLSCAPFFYKFEKKATSSREIVLIAVMVALSSMGRFVFAAIPGFKPVTAIVVITAIYFGAEAGFVTGSLSALVSNMFFGQGPWTPFQMFVWGFLGFAAGIISPTGFFKNRVFLSAYGIISGIAFSLMMDVWTVLSIDGEFNTTRYIAAVAASFPFMATYAMSNVIFLLVLEKPIGKKLERIKSKYELYDFNH